MLEILEKIVAGKGTLEDLNLLDELASMITDTALCGLGLLKDKDHSKMLENLAPCFEKVFTVTPDSPRAMTAEELEEEAKYHMDAEAAPSVAKAIRLAVDYADENNLAGVVVCGSLYLAAQARPLLLKEAEK